MAPSDRGTGEADALHAATDLTGQTIGPYQIAARLGGGAMAVVYQARDPSAGHEVALKLLLPGADGQMRERFRREAHMASVLEHPHIVRTHQVGQASQGIIYIAMELVTGLSLADVLEQRGRLTPGEACRLLEPIARALAYAHEQGVVHRDVKPGNILLHTGEEGTPGAVQLRGLPDAMVPLLSDFGIARALDAPELTSAGRTIGTPAFMAPEQCAGAADIDGRADIYSLGAVLYRCVVGRPPFGGTTTQILHAHVYDPLLIPEELARVLPHGIMAILTRSMMKEPSMRFPNMTAMAKELAACGAAVAPGDALAVLPDESDPTMTMAALPTAKPPGVPVSRILVPAAPVTPRGSVPVLPRAILPKAPAQVAPTRASAPPPGNDPPRRRIRGNLLGALILGSALVLLAVLLGVTLFSGFIPAMTGTIATPTVPVTSTTGIGIVPDSDGEPGMASPVAETPETAEEQDEVDALSETPEPTATASPVPPPAVPVESAWGDAQVFFAERDWQAALDWLTIVRRIDEEFEQSQVEEMLAVAYVGLATEATLEGRLEDAVQLMEEAVSVRPGVTTIAAIHEATTAYAQADLEERDAAREDLQGAYAAYAAAQFQASDACVAAEQLTAALQLAESASLARLLGEYRLACDTQQQADVLREVGGSIIYSSQEADRYRVLRTEIGQDSTPVLLAEDAAQPRLDPEGRTLAYYSTRPDALGLYARDLWSGAQPGERGTRLTEFTGDARDAPAAWSAGGDRLAFTSTRFGDGRYRIYLAWADGSGANDSLGYGKDPAWHPSQDLIVFNGTDELGSRPGLWLARPEGSWRTQLTDNGNDQRPAWTPDGRFIVFMSSGRDGNWELYRLDTIDLSIVRLTDHPAQDGLPTISPDGAHVAFMSDRDGYWRIWYLPLDGGEALPLGDISGEMPKWLEHGIQWVR